VRPIRLSVRSGYKEMAVEDVIAFMSSVEWNSAIAFNGLAPEV